MTKVPTTSKPDGSPRRVSPPRVVVYGYYGTRNLGDDLLLTVTLDRLRKIMPGARFFVRDHGYLADRDYGSDVTPAPLERLLGNQNRVKVLRYCDYLAAWRRLLREADWLIVGGGTVFHAYGSLRPLLLQYVIFRMARFHGVKLVALGVGVSDLPTPPARTLLSSIIRSFEAFLVRDAAGLRQCAGTKAEPSGDLVFAWQGLSAWHGFSALAAPRASGADFAVGLTVSPPACADDRVVEALRRFVMRLQAKNHRVVFLVFQRTGHVPGDESVFGRIAAGLDDTLKPEVRALDPAPQNLASAFADIGVVVGMRFHGLVLSAILGKPFVGIAHDNKISDLCQRLGMPWLDADLGSGEGADGELSGGELAENLVRSTMATWGKILDPAAVATETDNAEINFRRLAQIVDGRTTSNANARTENA